METIQIDTEKRLQVWSHKAGVTLQTEDADGRGGWQVAQNLTVPSTKVAELVVALQALD